MAKKLYIGNLSWGVETPQLKELFEKYGEVEDAIVMKDNRTNRSKGFGFVTFANDADADSALEALNGQEFDGRELRIDVAKPPKPREERSYGSRF